MQASLDIYRRGFCCRSFWRLDTLREEPEVVKGGRLEPWGWRREILQELLATDLVAGQFHRLRYEGRRHEVRGH